MPAYCKASLDLTHINSPQMVILHTLLHSTAGQGSAGISYEARSTCHICATHHHKTHLTSAQSDSGWPTASFVTLLYDSNIRDRHACNGSSSSRSLIGLIAYANCKHIYRYVRPACHCQCNVMQTQT